MLLLGYLFCSIFPSFYFNNNCLDFTPALRKCYTPVNIYIRFHLPYSHSSQRYCYAKFARGRSVDCSYIRYVKSQLGVGETYRNKYFSLDFGLARIKVKATSQTKSNVGPVKWMVFSLSLLLFHVPPLSYHGFLIH